MKYCILAIAKFYETPSTEMGNGQIDIKNNVMLAAEIYKLWHVVVVAMCTASPGVSMEAWSQL